MERFLKNGPESELKVFSLRLPKELARQIDARAKLTRRTRNSEIVSMLETHIDLMVARDQAMLNQHKLGLEGAGA